MRQIFYMCLDAAMAAVLLLPVFAVLNHFRFRSLGRSVCYFAMAVYLSAMYAVAGLPNIVTFSFDPNINLVPFRFLFSYLWNHLLNVLLFVPLGFFLPVLFRRYGKFRRTLAFGVCLSLAIELMQLFSFRATDVNDLMTNTLGTILGFLVGKLYLRAFPSVLPSGRTKDAFVVCGAAAGVMFFLHPLLSNYIWGRFYSYLISLSFPLRFFPKICVSLLLFLSEHGIIHLSSN